MNDQKNGEGPKTVVDLRASLPDIRDQGTRPTCLAFAASDAHSHFQGFVEHLSVEYLTYYAYVADGHQNYSMGLSTDGIITVLRNKGQPYETDWPYQPFLKKPVEPSPNLSPIYNVNCVEKLSWTPSEFIQILDQRKAIIIGVKITDDFFGHIPPPYVIEGYGTMMGLHALVLVGYGELSTGDFVFLSRNSWGKAWANNGYSWLTKRYLKNNMIIYITLN